MSEAIAALNNADKKDVKHDEYYDLWADLLIRTALLSGKANRVALLTGLKASYDELTGGNWYKRPDPLKIRIEAELEKALKLPDETPTDTKAAATHTDSEGADATSSRITSATAQTASPATASTVTAATAPTASPAAASAAAAKQVSQSAPEPVREAPPIPFPGTAPTVPLPKAASARQGRQEPTRSTAQQPTRSAAQGPAQTAGLKQARPSPAAENADTDVLPLSGWEFPPASPQTQTRGGSPLASPSTPAGTSLGASPVAVPAKAGYSPMVTESTATESHASAPAPTPAETALIPSAPEVESITAERHTLVAALKKQVDLENVAAPAQSLAEAPSLSRPDLAQRELPSYARPAAEKSDDQPEERPGHIGYKPISYGKGS